MNTEEIYKIQTDDCGWRKLPNGNYVKLGNGVTLGNYVRLGDGVTLGNYVTLGNGVTLGDGVTSLALNNQFIDHYKNISDKHIFTKWVTKDRMSPNFDGGTPLNYKLGKIIEIAEAEISDQQCGPGLHILRRGHRPEWYGLCSAYHDLIAIDVEVKSRDILFAGLPTMDGKLRVRKLKVLT